MAWSSFRPLLIVAVSGLIAGCAGSRLPDPRQAARAYAGAVSRGDADAVHAMLTREAQRSLGSEGTRRLVASERGELTSQARALLGPELSVEANATIPLADGSNAELTLEREGFRVAAAETLPSAARTPSEALEGLRRALGRRSYAALLRVLSTESRGALESDMRSLVTGLADPSSLDVRVNGDRAEVEIPGGHAVTLKREGGIWRVDDVK
ncbi:MAG TPA: hypothetical protein VGK73_38180 [Polyangiaceae bacterium]